MRGDILLIFVELFEAILLFGTEDDVEDEPALATLDDDVVVEIKLEPGVFPPRPPPPLPPPPILCVEADWPIAK